MNDEIHAETVRLISEDSDQLGILPIQEALQIALDRDLDLVEISPNADPPVCRVMDGLTSNHGIEITGGLKNSGS